MMFGGWCVIVPWSREELYLSLVQTDEQKKMVLLKLIGFPEVEKWSCLMQPHGSFLLSILNCTQGNYSHLISELSVEAEKLKDGRLFRVVFRHRLPQVLN